MMHQVLQGATFHIEHIIPRSRGGASELDDLALACPSCNLHKSDRTTAIDPATGSTVRLFHPRQQVWSEHFRFSGLRIEGVTPRGRATAGALVFNHPRRLRIRAAEQEFGLYPPVG
jgi:hypothetical protein